MMTRFRGVHPGVSIGLLLVLALASCRSPATEIPITGPTQAPTEDLSILYQDSFTDPASGWPDNTAGSVKSGYHPPDAFHLEVAEPNALAFVFREQDFGNFSVAAQVFIDKAGDSGEWRHGLAFRQVSDGHFYAFLINPRAGTWQVVKRDGEAWGILAEGTNDSILSEAKAVNTLRVDADGPEMTFAINGLPAVAIRDSTYPAGDFGFVVETLDATLAHIHFDSIVVRRFDAENVPAAPTVAPTPEAEAATPTETATPTPTSARGTVAPPVNLQTAVAGTATALAGTAPVLQTVVPPFPTSVCGLPGLPPCP